jgi:DNA-binding GntR family transcriptional regulator
MTPSPLVRRSIPEALAEQLRGRILAGELPQGTALRQDALARQYGVSRIPLREALRRLEAEGLVRIEPNKGAMVADFPPEEIGELFQMRAALESDLVRLAVPRLVRADADEASAALAAYEEALDRGQVADWGALNWRFHAALYRAAGRPRWLELVAQLNRQTDRFVRLQLALTGALDRARSEHRDILLLAEKGDAGAVAALVRRHILEAGQMLVAALAAERHAGERTAAE